MAVTIKDLLTVKEFTIAERAGYFSQFAEIFGANTVVINVRRDFAYSVNGHTFTPCPRLAVEYFLAYVSERYSEIDWDVIEKGRVFTDYSVLRFRYLENQHFLFLDDGLCSYATEQLTMFDTGFIDDAPILALIEEEIGRLPSEERLAMYGYLAMLGIREPTNKIEVVENPIIPPNSDTLLMDETTSRFSSAMWFDEIQKKTIILAGVGGIGSYVGFLLSRMKPKALFIYDDDRVEAANMSGQLYCSSDIGHTKVDALQRFVGLYSGYASVFAVAEKFTDNCEACDIMICGFDNMTARKVYYNKWLSHVKSKGEEARKHCLFIDGRLSAEELQVLCIRGDDLYNIRRYKDKFLFSDEEADATVCSYKQTSYMANMIGSIIVNLFTNFVANEITDGIRDLPFFTSYDGESMMFKVES